MEGAPHTAKRTIDVLSGAPAPIYKGGEEEAAGQEGARHGGSPTRTPLLVGFAPLFLSDRRGKRKERERERERGPRPLLLVLFKLPRRGARATPPWAYLSLP